MVSITFISLFLKNIIPKNNVAIEVNRLMQIYFASICPVLKKIFLNVSITGVTGFSQNSNLNFCGTNEAG